MKFTIDIDCTPEEARSFFGFDNPMMTEEMCMQFQRRIMEKMGTASLENWQNQSAGIFEEWQKTFWASMAKPADKKK